MGLASKELVALCKELGLPVKSHMSTLDDQQRATVESAAKAKTSGATEAAPPEAKGRKTAATKAGAKAPRRRPAAKPSAPAQPTTQRTAPSPAAPPKPPRDAPAARGGTPTRVGPVRRGRRMARTGRVRPRGRPAPTSTTVRAAVRPRPSKVELQSPISVKSLSSALGIPAADIIRRLMKVGVMANINAALEDEAAETVATELGVTLTIKPPPDMEAELLASITQDKPGDVTPRAPVVTFLGHVDHGKTSLLDVIRRSRVVEDESGGITQHIGAYRVDRGNVHVTFLDTPGHEAFTAMRARGANVTDVVVLVVAADDGVMPQTEEAISHAKAADVPIVVAINKTDKPEANVNRTLQQLSTKGLVPEEWGGDVVTVRTSAVTKEGIDDLLEMLSLVAELRELRGNPDRPAVGTCLEAELSEGRGVLCTFLVQQGTLHRGDLVLCGTGYGRAKALYDDTDRAVRSAGPSTPVKVSGLAGMPAAGDQFLVVSDLHKARAIATQRQDRVREASLAGHRHVTLENLFSRIEEEEIGEVCIILKTDVRGSLEAIKQEIDKLKHEEVQIRVLHEGVGGISESDVLLADASDAIIIGFHVAAEERARVLADEKGVDIQVYQVIYRLTQDLRAALEGMLKPERREVRTGRAEVRELFRVSRVGTIAGCHVTEGLVTRQALVRVHRDNVTIHEGRLTSLRRFKDDAREVREGFECGMKVEGFDDVKVGDVIEAFRIEEVKRTL